MKPFLTVAMICFLAVMFATGCATDNAEPALRTVEVRVPVAVPCIAKDFPAKPAYPDTREALKAAPDQAARYRLMAAGWPLRAARLQSLEAAVEPCRQP